MLDLSKYDGLSVLAIAALIITLAGAFFLERLARLRADIPILERSGGP